MTRHIQALILKKGERALYQGKIVVIEAVLDLNLAMVKDLASGEDKQVQISHLMAPPQEETSSASSFVAVNSPEAKEQAEYRRDVISPLLNRPGRTRADVKARAAEYNLHPNTIYGWLRKFEACRELSALVRQQRSDKGAHKLDDDETERLITLKLESLKPEERYPTAIHMAIKKSIENANSQRMSQTTPTESINSSPSKSLKLIAIPSLGTIRNRFDELPLKRVVMHRQGKQAAQHLFDPILKQFPGAEWPSAVWQIDHAKLDIKVRDPFERLPLGKRPWITLSIDVCSRVVPGYEYSLDPPGDMSTGLCIANSILPKEQWLASRGCTGEWPIWGKPATIHGDNAFRTKMLKQACRDHGMNLEWRPVKQPHYGGHIERLCGSLASSIHLLPGTTYSNVDERGEYDSEAKSIFTPDEFQEWLDEKILAYNASPHSALGMSPMERYRQGVFEGTANYPPTGLQPRIVDPLEQRRLQLDLMPFTLRTIQRYGVEIDNIFYYSDVLGRWINAPNPDHPQLKRKFMFRLFRRDISSIWFFDPDIKDYFEIPTRDSTFPAMSIWELREIRRHAKSEGIPMQSINEDYIKRRHMRMREIQESAQLKTKAARDERTRREKWASAPRPRIPNAKPVEQTIHLEETYEPVGEFSEDE
jgi:putative transposase